MPKLAQVNIAKLKDAIDSPLLADFAAQIEHVNTQGESAPGFLWRLKDETGDATALSAASPFGPQYLINLTVWKDVQSLKEFAYKQSDHRDAFAQRSKWFEKMPTAHFAMWWLRDDETPTVIDAKRRLEHLTEHGETDYAFLFKRTVTPEQAIAPDAHIQYLLRLADDALIHSQRLSEWCGHGPILEEDMALANIALDYLGQARLLYSHIGRIEGRSRNEDDLAYWRNENEFFNSTLVEHGNDSIFGEQDYAITITKLFLHSIWMLQKWRQLQNSSDTYLQGVASKAIKETLYHCEHASQWMIRFGDGTEQSRARVQNALTRLWPLTNEWFTDDAIDIQATQLGLAPANGAAKAGWVLQVHSVLKQAKLDAPTDTNFFSTGKAGYHSESLSYLLSEMQSIARQHPGAQW